MGLLVGRPNPAGPARVYLRTLIFVFCGEAVLLIFRRQPPDAGFWNAIGGKIDLGEDPLDGAQRELQEEAGIRAPLDYRGVATAIVRSTGEHWAIFLFSARVAHPTVVASSEGPLRWVRPGEIPGLALWPDIPVLLPYIRDPEGGVILAKFTYASPDPAALERSSIRVATYTHGQIQHG